MPGTAEKLVDTGPEQVINGLMDRARAAMDAFADADQAKVDEAVTAIAWSIYEPGRAKELAEIAVEDTGLGNVSSKIIKNQRKTFGCLRDLMRVKTVGVIEELPEKGLVKYAKPVGVVGAVCPSTNPAATPINKAMLAVKGKNAVVIAPSPAGLKTSQATVDYMRAELKKVGAPEDLVQCLPSPVNKALTQALMEAVDLVVITGSQNNVRRGYSSGTPCIGVGAGNVPVIIDETADFMDAAEKIKASKIFDNSTSCSSENSVTVLENVYEPVMDAFRAVGGYVCSPEEKEMIRNTLWQDGHLNRRVIAKDPDIFAKEVGLPEEAQKASFFIVEEPSENVGKEHPFSEEKLSLVLTAYKVADFQAAKDQVQKVLDFVGMGHSVGIHTKDQAHADELAEDLKVVRVIVNQAHTFGNGGSFNNGLEFTLTMGCGTWAGNSISENLNYKHFINTTHLVREIPEDKPEEIDLFGAHWEKYGK